MKTTAEYERLARITGLPNLESVQFDPERLESLARIARSMWERTIGSTSPLRFKVALDQYAQAADWLLERPAEE